MKKLLALLMLLLFLLLTFFSWKWYKHTILCCNTVDENVEQVKVIDKAAKLGPLVYNWDNSEAITNDLWSAKQEEIINGLKDGRSLEISSPYFEAETNNSEYENIGIARAEAVKKLFEGKIDLDRIETKGNLVDFYDDAKTTSFENTNFNWVVRNENIKEIAGKTLIYFPNNSANKLDNANINTYLKDVAVQVSKTGQTVSLVGHTDSRGNDAANKALALKRANTIKSILISNGVSSDKITTSSNGEETPIATNETEEGRQKNRRVELEIK